MIYITGSSEFRSYYRKKVDSAKNVGLNPIHIRRRFNVYKRSIKRRRRRINVL